MKNGSSVSSSEKFPILLEKNIAVFGGFNGKESSIYDRTDNVLATPAPLGLNGYSGTILSAGSDPALVIGDGQTSVSVIFDGFQMINGDSSVTDSYCGAQQASGGITICKAATAVLRNLRLDKNSTSGSGGGIRNMGTMLLNNSVLSLNHAQLQGGGISSESSGSANRIENVVFFGNSIISDISSGIPSILQPLCTAGGAGTCPSGLTCPPGGGPCTGAPQPACTSAAACPEGMVCSTSGACGWPPANGGAVAITAGSLNIFASKFSANHAYNSGGGIYAEGTVNVASSIFVNNWASSSGGAIHISQQAPAATLQNLTLIDNRAYNQPNGAIFDGAGSTVVNSLFRNNKALYAINSSRMSEWAGNRFQGGAAPSFPIGALAPVLNFTAPANPAPTGKPGSYSYLDVCPSIGYIPNPNSTGNSIGNRCSGLDTEICGIPPSAAAQISGTGFSTQSTFNYNAVADRYGAINKCSQSEFVNCVSPLYTNCAPAEGWGIGSSSTLPALYPNDFTGAPLANFEGAYNPVSD
ncbi:MAG: hypothetical protein V4534_00865 [Myxococcota bacterium]